MSSRTCFGISFESKLEILKQVQDDRLQAMQNNPMVSVIIVHLYGVDFLVNCLESVFKSDYPNLEVVVVFNGHLDNSFEIVKERFPQTVTIKNEKNLGFVFPNNQGIKKSSGEIIFLLNDDTTIHPRLISILAEKLINSEAVGVVGPKIYFMNEPEKIWFAGGAVDWRRQTTEHLGRGNRDNPENSTEGEVDFITGCALMIKKEMIEKIGLLNERLFAFYEDADWCQRAKKAGYKISYVPFGGVWHAKSATAGSVFFGSEKQKNRLWLAGAYFWRVFMKEFRIYRNGFYFFSRYAPFQWKAVFWLKFVFVLTPVFLWKVLLRLPFSFLSLVKGKSL